MNNAPFEETLLESMVSAQLNDLFLMISQSVTSIRSDVSDSSLEVGVVEDHIMNGDDIFDVMVYQNPVETKARVIEASVEAMRKGNLQPDSKLVLAFTDALYFGGDAQLSSLAQAGLSFIAGIDPKLEMTCQTTQNLAEGIIGVHSLSARELFLSKVVDKVPELNAIQFPVRPSLTADTVIGRLRGMSMFKPMRS